MPVRRTHEFMVVLPLKKISAVFSGNDPSASDGMSTRGDGSEIGRIFSSRSCQRRSARMRSVGSAGWADAGKHQPAIGGQLALEDHVTLVEQEEAWSPDAEIIIEVDDDERNRRP